MELNDYLSRLKQLKSLYEKVKRDFSTKGLVHHNWNHVLRDLATAIMIGEAEKANMKVVLASILLHDIGRLYPEPGKDHYTVGAKIATNYLRDAGFTNEEIEAITHYIKVHGPRGLEEPKTIEAKVVYDVEVLSCSVGYIGVARVFDHFMREEGMSLSEMMQIPSDQKGPRKDFYTRTGQMLGEKGLQKARNFWKELRKEIKEENQRIKKIASDYEEG